MDTFANENIKRTITNSAVNNISTGHQFTDFMLSVFIASYVGVLINSAMNNTISLKQYIVDFVNWTFRLIGLNNLFGYKYNIKIESKQYLTANAVTSTDYFTGNNKDIITAILDKLIDNGVVPDTGYGRLIDKFEYGLRDRERSFYSSTNFLNELPKSEYDRRKQFKCSLLPTEGVKFGDVFIKYNRTSTPNNKTITVIETLTISSNKITTEQINEQIITKSLVDYANKYYKHTSEDDLLYYYVQMPNNNRKFDAKSNEYNNIHNPLLFTKYVFNSRTTFNGIFYPDKQKIIRLIDELEKGNLGRLNLLLYGEPGTGKSSTIKAIANATQRHIVNVKLSTIPGDLALTDYLHNRTITLSDGTASTKEFVPLNKRIYVFEDIDAESKIVHDREKAKEDKIKKNKLNKNNIIVTTENNKTSFDKNKITLSGLLNTLDGILELNDAILIMTTNYKDKLDPALIRSGRINLAVELKRMSSEDAACLIEKYFGEKLYITSDVITPADLEALCVTSENIDELRQNLKKYQYEEISMKVSTNIHEMD